jgi:hypothetical protein
MSRLPTMIAKVDVLLRASLLYIPRAVWRIVKVPKRIRGKGSGCLLWVKMKVSLKRATALAASSRSSRSCPHPPLHLHTRLSLFCDLTFQTVPRARFSWILVRFDFPHQVRQWGALCLSHLPNIRVARLQRGAT